MSSKLAIPGKRRRTAAAVTPDVQTTQATLIALSCIRSRPSAINVRTTEPTGIESLADSILAVGLLQNLVVIPCAKDDHYEVVAGGRRLAALRLLVKRRKLPADHPVPCLITPADTARAASLTENVQREAMHPADEFLAFASLTGEGKPVEDIAAAFGVTPLVVKRRLLLASVSPRLMTDYRAGKLTLEQMMAFTVSTDVAAQEAAFYQASEWSRSAHLIRARLLGARVGDDDRRVRFIGLQAYRDAGGTTTEDLFASGSSAFLDDPALLDGLVQEHLEGVAGEVRAEGWQWVRIQPSISYADTAGMRRLTAVLAKPTPEQADLMAALDARQRDLQAQLDEINEPAQPTCDDQADDSKADESDEHRLRLSDALDAVDDEADALRQSLAHFPEAERAIAGAFVSLDPDGAMRILRGYVERSQFAALAALGAGPAGQTDRQAEPDTSGGEDDSLHGETDPQAGSPTGAGLSASLCALLSEERTAALQIEVARRPHTALALLVNRLAGEAILNERDARVAHTGCEPITIRPSVIEAVRRAGDLGQPSPATAALRAHQAEWAARLAADPAQRFEQLCALSTGDLLDVLAICVGRSVDARMDRPTGRVPALALAEAVDLDMREHWQATADSYFGKVTRQRILDAVGEFAPDQVRRLSALKRKEMAQEAEGLCRGSGWLPQVLRRAPRRHEADSRRSPVAAAGTGCGDPILRATSKIDERGQPAAADDDEERAAA